MPRTLPNFIEDLQDPELAPMLSPARYISLLEIDVETLARNARVPIDPNVSDLPVLFIRCSTRASSIASLGSITYFG